MLKQNCSEVEELWRMDIKGTSLEVALSENQTGCGLCHCTDAPPVFSTDGCKDGRK